MIAASIVVLVVGVGVGDDPTRASDDATPAVVDVSTPSDLADERAITTRVVDASATRSPAVAAGSTPGRRVAGHVVFDDGAPVVGARLVLLPVDRSARRDIVTATVGDDGGFDVRLPNAPAWAAETVAQCRVIRAPARPRACGWYPLDEQMRIVVRRDDERHWRVTGTLTVVADRADLRGHCLLRSQDGRFGHGDTPWRVGRNGVELQLGVMPAARIDGDVHWNVVDRDNTSFGSLVFRDLTALRDALAGEGLTVRLLDERVVVPDRHGVDPITAVEFAAPRFAFGGKRLVPIERRGRSVVVARLDGDESSLRVAGYTADRRLVAEGLVVGTPGQLRVAWHTDANDTTSAVVRVVDATDTPVARAFVSFEALREIAPGVPVAIGHAERRTDADGRVTVRGLPAGEYRFRASHLDAPGRPPADVVARIPGGDVTIRLSPHSRVVVVPSLTTPASIEDAQVWWRPASGGAWQTAPDYPHLADALHGVAPGPTEFVLHAPPLRGHARFDVQAIEAVQRVDVACTHAATVDGVVVDTDGAPVEGVLVAQVTAVNPTDAAQPSPFAFARARSGADGTFRLALEPTEAARIGVWPRAGNAPLTVADVAGSLRLVVDRSRVR